MRDTTETCKTFCASSHTARARASIPAEAVNLLALLVQSGGDCRRADETAVSVIKSVLELLVQSLQGPCQGNQHYIVTSANAMNIVNTVLSSPFQRVAEASALRAKGLAVKLIASCLEGRDDHVVHARLADVLELPTLASFAKDLNVKYLPKMRELALEILVDFEHTMVQLNQQGSENSNRSPRRSTGARTSRKSRFTGTARRGRDVSTARLARYAHVNSKGKIPRQHGLGLLRYAHEGLAGMY